MFNNNNVIVQVQELLDEAISVVSNSIWRNKYVFSLQTLQEELNSPCVLAVAGKVKAGKSFLINALLGVDIAVTGNTETTATVNIFKKGSPLSKDRPILCIYVDGRKEWISKEQLMSLQGTSDEALSKTAQIDKLIIYINDNPLLDYVTLVDTPGIGAEVGEEGDSHQIHTDAYFKLRARHQQETISLSNSADAIIYLFNTVPTEKDKVFLTSLYDSGHGLSSLNGIGVLSKVDKDLSQVENIPRFCSEFEHNLFDIIPTSAAIEKYLPSIDDAYCLKEKLRKGFSQDKGFDTGIMSPDSFLHEKLPFCNMTIEERKTILRSFAETDLAWSSFALIAKQLYYSDDIAETLNKLRDIGGISNLKNIIFNHFFNRSHMLRCHKVIEELRRIINNIIFDESYVYAEERAQMKGSCINECQKLSPDVRSFVIDLIEEHIPSVQQVKAQHDDIFRLKNCLEQISERLRIVNDYFMTYQKVVACKEQFSSSEFDELCALFSGQDVVSDLRLRYKYWTSVLNTSTPNSIRYFAANVARSRYLEFLKS